MVSYFFLLRLDSCETVKHLKKDGNSGKCQEGVHFLINIFTIIGELDLKCLVWESLIFWSIFKIEAWSLTQKLSHTPSKAGSSRNSALRELSALIARLTYFLAFSISHSREYWRPTANRYFASSPNRQEASLSNCKAPVGLPYSVIASACFFNH